MSSSFKHSYSSAEQTTSDHQDREGRALRAVTPVTARSKLHLVSPQGQLRVHTAPFRGSYSVVMSEALRAAGLGSRVLITQFLKGGVSQGPEGSIQLCGKLEWLRPNVSYCISEPATKSSTTLTETREKSAVNEIWQTCKRQLTEGVLDQVVLDELGMAIELGYLDEEEILATLEQRPGTLDVTLTGPSIPTCLMNIADQVTELRCSF